MPELNDFYQGRNEKKMARWKQRQQLIDRAVDEHLAIFHSVTGREKPESFVDIGGGVGHYVRSFSQRGTRACLLDMADDALDFARDTLGISWIVRGDVQNCANLLEPSSFEYVQARHVVEHVRDPAAFLSGIAEVLTEGGLLQIETPNAESWEQFAHPAIIRSNFRILRDSNPDMSSGGALVGALRKSMSGVNPPKHLWGFSSNGLGRLLESCGFEVLRLRTAIAGHPIYDPLYYDLHPLSGRRGAALPYYFWEKGMSALFRSRGTNLAALARRRRWIF
jgi:SAM-dependent methyltransferase